MAVEAEENNYINFVEMQFTDNTLYFVGKSKAIGQIQVSSKCIQLEKAL